MNLQTKIVLPKKVRNPISYPSKILLLGSCFSENIGKKLEYFKFQTNQNPFGILFHPKAIEKCIVNAIQQKTYTALYPIYKLLFEHRFIRSWSKFVK